MNPFLQQRKLEALTVDAAETLALQAAAAVFADSDLSHRFLDLSGATPEEVRAGLTDRRFLAGLLEFLLAHEPSLLQVAAAIEQPPDQIGLIYSALRAA